MGATVGFVLLWLVFVARWSDSIVQAELTRYCITTGDTYLRALHRVPVRIRGPRGPVGWPIWLTEFRLTSDDLATGFSFDFPLEYAALAIAMYDALRGRRGRSRLSAKVQPPGTSDGSTSPIRRQPFDSSHVRGAATSGSRSASAYRPGGGPRPFQPSNHRPELAPSRTTGGIRRRRCR